MKIVYTVQARQDLRSIYEYLAYTLQVPDTAGRMAERIMDGVRSLKSMPERNPLSCIKMSPGGAGEFAFCR